MKVMMIPIVVGTFGMVPKGLRKRLRELEIKGRTGIIQIPTVLKSGRILRKVLETGGNLLSLRHQ